MVAVNDLDRQVLVGEVKMNPERIRIPALQHKAASWNRRLRIRGLVWRRLISMLGSKINTVMTYFVSEVGGFIPYFATKTGKNTPYFVLKSPQSIPYFEVKHVQTSVIKRFESLATQAQSQAANPARC